MSLVLSLALVGLQGCHGKDGEVDPNDVDGDGFETADDCDDSAADVNPDAAEHCDGIDTNCDGELDGPAALEATAYYADSDADGYGNPDVVRVECEAPNEFFVTNADDCNDTRADVFPGAQEFCDTVDDDCDGAVDEDDALDQHTVYVDADGDGAGDPNATSEECGVPDGFAADPDDCDDTNPAVSPLGVEVCNDGLDGDCDGSPYPCGPAGEKDLTVANVTVLGAGDSHLGTNLAAGDRNGDGNRDVAIQGQSSTVGGGANAKVELFDGPLSGTIDAAIDSDTTVEVSQSHTSYYPPGMALVLEDLDGDGYDDVVAGSVAGVGGGGKGVFVFLSPFSGTVSPTSADLAITAATANSRVGESFAGIGDIDDDGHEDYAVTDAQDGVVYFFSVPITSDVVVTDLGRSLGPACTGTDCNLMGGFGTTVAGRGDLDGDGRTDLVISAPQATLTGFPAASYEGQAFVFTGPIQGEMDSDSAVATITGGRTSGFFGAQIEIHSDMDGDGYDDLVWGDGYADYITASGKDPGRAGIFYGPLAGSYVTEEGDLVIEGQGADGTGDAVAVADADADGLLDLFVGDATEDGDVPGAGAVFFLRGPLGTGTISTTDADGRMVGLGPDEAGTSVRNLGDLNGDGVDDVAIGAPGYAVTVGDQGAAFLLFGGGM